MIGYYRTLLKVKCNSCDDVKYDSEVEQGNLVGEWYIKTMPCSCGGDYEHL